MYIPHLMAVLWSKRVPPFEDPLWEGHTIRAEGCDASHLCVIPGEEEIGQTPHHKSPDVKTPLAKQLVS